LSSLAILLRQSQARAEWQLVLRGLGGITKPEWNGYLWAHTSLEILGASSSSVQSSVVYGGSGKYTIVSLIGSTSEALSSSGSMNDVSSAQPMSSPMPLKLMSTAVSAQQTVNPLSGQEHANQQHHGGTDVGQLAGEFAKTVESLARVTHRERGN
jgi:hypothetical protein